MRCLVELVIFSKTIVFLFFYDKIFLEKNLQKGEIIVDKKKIIIIVAIVAILLIVVLACFFGNNNSSVNNNVNNNNSQNNNIVNNADNNSNNSEQNKEPEFPTKEIKGTITLDNLVFNELKMVQEGVNQNVLVATVKNNGTENIVDGSILNIELFTENGDSIGIVGGILPFVAADSIAEMRVPIALDVMHTDKITIKYANR